MYKKVSFLFSKGECILVERMDRRKTDGLVGNMLTVELREWKWTIVRGGLDGRSSKRGGLVAVSFILAITQRLRASCIRAMARLTRQSEK